MAQLRLHSCYAVIIRLVILSMTISGQYKSFAVLIILRNCGRTQPSQTQYVFISGLEKPSSGKRFWVKFFRFLGLYS